MVIPGGMVGFAWGGVFVYFGGGRGHELSFTDHQDSPLI